MWTRPVMTSWARRANALKGLLPPAAAPPLELPGPASSFSSWSMH